MTGPGADAAPFELLRLAAEEVAAGIALVELEGRFAGPVPDGLRLSGAAPVVRRVDDGTLRATFAVGLEQLASLRLQTDEIVVRLPQPDGGRTDRLAALAREANSLRHRVFDAEGRADELREQLDAAAVVAADRDTLRGRVEELEDEGRMLRKQLQRARADVERLSRELRQAQEAGEAARPARVPAGDAPPTTVAEPDDPGPAAADERPALPVTATHVRATEDDDTYDLLPAESVRLVKGAPSPRRRAGDPSAVPTADVDPPPVALYVALAVFGGLGFVLVLLLLL
jgi:hypothetical protein